MYHGSQRGWIEVIAGVMFSGKSEELIRRIRRATIARKRVQVFKSHLDDRYGTRSAVASHDGSTLEGRDRRCRDRTGHRVIGTETYDARCRHCQEVPGIAARQTQLFQDQHS